MTAGTEQSGQGKFSAQEKAAMKQRAAELKAEARRASADEKTAEEKKTFDARIAEMPQPDRGVAERLHEIVTEAAPELRPKLYYGQPGWAKAGKVIVFFRSGLMDKARYSTLGFSVEAALDEKDGFWPTAYALESLSDATASAIAEQVRKAAG
jgi:hypothetical protein